MLHAAGGAHYGAVELTLRPSGGGREHSEVVDDVARRDGGRRLR